MSEKLTSVIIKTPQSLTTLTATARAIMEELRERHKALEKGGSRKPHPSELLTLDKLPEALMKYTNLSEQSRSLQAVDQALKQLTDYQNKGKDRYLYLYPYLLKSATKVVAKIALIAPQTAHEIDATPYIQACFEYSKSTIDLILNNRSRKVKEIDENQPGLSLFQKNNKGLDWLYPDRFSLETEVGLLVKSGFKPYSHIPIKEFTDHFIQYGESKNLLEVILPNYHMIIDEIQVGEDGNYVRQPEMVIHYRAQADGLERFALMYLPKLADEGAPEYRSKIAQYQTLKNNDPPNRRQNREKVKALITLVKNFPYGNLSSELGKNFQETAMQSVKILEVLLSKMDTLIERKYKSTYKTLFSSILQQIPEHTKTNLSLLALDLKKEFEKFGVKEEEKIKEFSSKIIEEIKKTYPLREVNIDGKKIYYTVDQSYMAAVLHKYSTTPQLDDVQKKEYELAKIINQEMLDSKNPRLNINIKSELMQKLNLDIQQKELEEKEKLRESLGIGKLNLIPGFLGLALSLFITFYLYSLDGDIAYLLFGIPVSLVIGYLAATLIKFNKFSFKTKEETSSTLKAIDVGEETKNEKVNAIAKVAHKYIYPANYNKITDKVYDSQSLKRKINEHIAEIQNSVPILTKEQDMSKVASSIEHSILQTSVVIAIPPEIVPHGKPNSIIISKNDFKAPLYRTQLAEHFRELLDKNKLDKALVKYYTFLINTLEVDYYKYLNKKIR